MRAVAGSSLEPAAAAKLDGDADRGAARRRPWRMCSRPAWPALNQGGNWNSTAPSLPAGLERRQRPAVGLPEQVLGGGRQVAQVDVALAGGRRRQQSLELGRQPLGRGAVAGEQGEGLDVEDEAGRRALDPELSVALVRRRVEGGVDLDDGKPRARRSRAGRRRSSRRPDRSRPRRSAWGRSTSSCRRGCVAPACAPCRPPWPGRVHTLAPARRGRACRRGARPPCQRGSRRSLPPTAVGRHRPLAIRLRCQDATVVL